MPTVTAYHVSPVADLAGFRAGTHFGTRAAAMERATANKYQGADLYLYRVRLTYDAALEIFDEGGVHDLEYLIDAVREASKMGRKAMNLHVVGLLRSLRERSGEEEALKGFAQALRSNGGYDCLSYRNQTEDTDSRSYVGLWPERIRLVDVEPLPAPATSMTP
jgi:hypothetical protein